MARERILLVEDDRAMLERLRKQLAREGYEIATAEDGAEALRLVAQFEPDLVILDITLPAGSGDDGPVDGIDVLRRVREDFETPVLMLSATSVGAVKVMALTLGADDYLTKPFDPQEFLARVQVILRRLARSAPAAREITAGGLRIDPESRRVWKEGEPVELTAIEFDLLLTLARRPNRVFSRDQLLELAWKHSFFGVPKVVDVHIGHIRRKIETDPARPEYIVTVRGVGYRFGVGTS